MGGWKKNGTAIVVNKTKARILAGAPHYIGSYLNSPLAGGPFCQGASSMWAVLPSTKQDEAACTAHNGVWTAILSATQWRAIQKDLQDVAMETGPKIPIIFGIDSVHGAIYVRNATVFPHQINQAAALNKYAVCG